MKSKELSRLRWHVARCCHGRFGQDGTGRSSKPFRLIRLLPPVISFWGPIPLFPTLARFPGDRHSLQLTRVSRAIEAPVLHPHATPKRVGRIDLRLVPSSDSLQWRFCHVVRPYGVKYYGANYRYG